MTANSLPFRLVAAAAVVFIAVLVWRVGTRVIFDDRTGPSGTVSPPASGSGEPPPSPVTGAADGLSSGARGEALRVLQATSGLAALTPQNAAARTSSLRTETLEGESTLSGWKDETDAAEWEVTLTQVGDGYLRAQIRYRSLQAVRLQLSAGGKRLALWNLPEARQANVEEKLIRLKQTGEYRLRVDPVGDATSLQLLEITLQPR